jgi:hypothetical protein
LVAAHANRRSLDVDFDRELTDLVILDLHHQLVGKPPADIVEEGDTDVHRRTLHQISVSWLAQYAQTFVVGEVLLLRLLELPVGYEGLAHLRCKGKRSCAEEIGLLLGFLLLLLQRFIVEGLDFKLRVQV